MKVSNIINRREFMIAAAAAAMTLPREVLSSMSVQMKFGWAEFQAEMSQLANAHALGDAKNIALESDAVKILQMLDVNAIDFKQALAESYATGNRYWLWQRMIKQKNINGGVLTIDNKQMVQLHDHPGATGVVRILSGEAEAWLFDEVKGNKSESGVAELSRVSRRVLRAGDSAVLTPDKGNIHALKALSKECSMLDFFIPPYDKNQRSWFETLTENWFDMETISCRKVSQNAYTKA